MKPIEKMQALLAKTPTRVLVESLPLLEAQERSPERNLVRGMTIEELERRYPQAAAAVESAYDAAEEQFEAGEGGEVDYVAVLVAAIPSEELA
jgi:hypothetical protein